MKRYTKWIAAVCLLVVLIGSFSGCAMFASNVDSMHGSIFGNTYEAGFYSNSGELFMTLSGQRIDLNANIVQEKTFSDDKWGYKETLSSVVTITIDGHQVENCGSTVLFAEKGLKPDVDFKQEMLELESQSHGIGSLTGIANVVNQYRNRYGKPTVVVIQSQLGDPICAYSGKRVYWEVCQDLPKTTKLMIDGKALYIHRANFQIIDTALLSE